MDALKELFETTINLERILTRKYHATGKGLYEKATSVSDRISPQCLSTILYVARIRNKAAHEDTNIAKQEIRNVRAANKMILRELAPRKFNYGLTFAIFYILAAIVVAYVLFTNYKITLLLKLIKALIPTSAYLLW